MQIEVTEREAMGIYSQRYLDSLGRKRYIAPVIFAVALLLALLTMYYVDDWLGVGVFVVLSSPSIYITFKNAKDSGKYAKRLIEDTK